MANRPRSLSMGDAMRLSAFTRMRPHRPDQLPDPNKQCVTSPSPHAPLTPASRTARSTLSSPACRTSPTRTSRAWASQVGPAIPPPPPILTTSSDATCPVCITPLLAIVAEEEMALAMDSPAHAPPEELGVTRLDGCGHIFCRKELSAASLMRAVAS